MGQTSKQPAIKYATPEQNQLAPLQSAAAAVFGVIAGLLGALMLFFGVRRVIWLLSSDRRRADGQDVLGLMLFFVIGLFCAAMCVRWLRDAFRTARQFGPARPMDGIRWLGTRKGLTTSLVMLAGGLLGLVALALSFVVTFFAMFYGLRLVCWATGNDDYMFFMWFSIVLVPIGGCLICALLGIGGMVYLDRRRNDRKPQSSKLTSDSPQPDAD